MTQEDSNFTDSRPAVSTQATSTCAPPAAATTRLPSTPLITVFALPKPFSRDTDLIQHNAIKSWIRLRPAVDVLLIGDDDGIAETARELGVRHAGGVQFNEHGTPLVSSAFEIAHRETTSPFLAYCNCDVILMKDFSRAVELLAQNPTFDQFIAFGQRTDLKVDQIIEFDQLLQIERLLEDCKKHGVRSSNVCKEYFVFNRGLYREVPPFAIGRGNWDNWMIHSAKMNQLPVVKVSDVVTAIHQSHGYSHLSAGRFNCYVSGLEAEENRRLAGGRHVVSGSTANWRLTSMGLKHEPPLLINPGFWADVPRFIRLLLNLMVG